MLLLCLLVALSVLQVLQGDIVTSLAKMEPLVHAHGEVLKNLNSYIEKEKARLSFLKKQSQIYEREQLRATSLPDYFANPINAFTFIKRLTVGLRVLENKIYNTTEYKRNSTLKYPDGNDFKEAVLGLDRIRSVYLLNISQFANGMIDGVQYSSPLSASDCHELGRELLSEKKYDKAIAWMKQALRRYSEKEVNTYTFRAEDIVEHISYGYHELGDYRKAAKWISRLLEMKPGDPKYIGHVKSLELYERRILQEDLSKTKSNWNFKYNFTRETPNNVTKEEKLYEALCRDMVTIPRSIHKRLKCKYLMTSHTFLQLAPIKIEQLYINPDVTLFHDVISDPEIKKIIDLAKPHLSKGRILKSKERASRLSDYRSSHVSWLSDNASRVVARLTRRVSDVTGLNAERSELLQVANYGLGGHFVPHLDAFPLNTEHGNNTNVNRIATVLFYLSDVPHGGSTVFPKLGVSVRPKRGSAIFWHNLLRSGVVDPAAMHAACPVVIGNKWVANKWILAGGQEFLRPCDLEDHEWTHRRRSMQLPPLKIRP